MLCFAVGAAVGPLAVGLVAKKENTVQLGFRHGDAAGIFAPDDIDDLGGQLQGLLLL